MDQTSFAEKHGFATTKWTLVREAGGTKNENATRALDALLGTYWQPLYRYARRSGKSPEDAEDLVQGFWTQIIERGALRLADPARGRFRSFLLGSLKHFMANEWRRQNRIKRGGTAPHFRIGSKDAETGLSLEPQDNASPDRLFDRDWALALLDKVLGDLEREDPDFARWKPFLGFDPSSPSYADIAETRGLSEGAARVAVHRMRKKFRAKVREEIAGTLADRRQTDEEMRALFAALTG